MVSHMAIQSQVAAPAWPPVKKAWYVVGALTFIYVFSFIDRQILNLLVAPIRRDLGISDTAMSLLIGFSFAVFYTLFGIPLGRLADRYSRRTIIAAGFAFWSLFTILCGFASGFAMMFVFRIGVGIGEAALSPAAFSLISDYFPPHNRSTALSVYGMGIFLGTGMAYVLGGAVVGLASRNELVTLPVFGEMRPWQTVFLAVGLPGLLLAFLPFSFAEPIRRGVHNLDPVPLREAWAFARRNLRMLFCHHFGTAMFSMIGYAAASWVPTWFLREFQWPTSRTGLYYGALVGIFGSLGIVSGGRFADSMLHRGIQDANFRVPLYASIGLLLAGCWWPLAKTAEAALLLVIPFVFLQASVFGVAPAGLGQAVPPKMRAQSSAGYLFVINIIGLGLGPSAVALITDYAFRNDAHVGWSLFVVCGGGILCSVGLWLAGLKPFQKSLREIAKISNAP